MVERSLLMPCGQAFASEMQAVDVATGDFILDGYPDSHLLPNPPWEAV